MALSIRTNQELLEPISAWLNDQDFMQRHLVSLQDGPSWTEYKRQQRDAERRIAREQQAVRLREYWAAIKRKKALLQEVAQLIPKRSSDTTSFIVSDTTTPDQDGLAAVFGPFSHSAENARQVAQEFQAVRSMSVSETLPWRTVLRAELRHQSLFRDLPTIHQEDLRRDRVDQFRHLLHMDHAGEVELEQDESGEITIRPREHREENHIIIKDQAGNELCVDWDALSDAQRQKVIADAVKNRIICKTRRYPSKRARS